MIRIDAVDRRTGEPVTIGGVHPVADLFPLLDGEEFTDLVASIKEQGLLDPIVLDDRGWVLDGRNRLRACQEAGVKPETVPYAGDDPDGYALTVNITRRHLSKGQQAMIAARARSVSGQSVRDLSKTSGLSTGRIGQAAVVLTHAPDLADAVLAGAKPLDAAYKIAQERKAAAESADAQMAKLRADAPDLADLVVEDRMTLAEATAAARERKSEAERQRRVATHLLCEHVVAVAQTHGIDTGARYDPAMSLPGRAVTRQVLLDAKQAITELLTTWKGRGLP
jgi:ParB-like chromosome segregation protein Spo0J